jgi:hypothetical protein
LATTSLIVEIIVIGVFALVWVMLFIFKFLGLDLSLIPEWLILYKDWSTVVALIMLIVSYQLGWLVNQLSYFIAGKTFNKPIKSFVFKDQYQNYDSIKTTVYMNGSSFAVEKVKERLSVVRLTRAAFINFLLISIALFWLNNKEMGYIAVGITIIMFVQALYIYYLYCQQIFNSYKVIKSNEEEQKKVQGKKVKTKK